MCFFFLLLNLFSVCFVHWGSSWKYFLFLTFIFSIIRVWNCQWQLSQLPTLERKAKAMGRWTVVDCEKKKIDGRWGGENIHTIIPKIDTRGKSGCFFFFFSQPELNQWVLDCFLDQLVGTVLDCDSRPATFHECNLFFLCFLFNISYGNPI